jgi:adenylate kinase
LFENPFYPKGPTMSDLPNRHRAFLIFGAPGSGKGTQGVTLGTLPRFYHMACGDVFRQLDTRTAIGQEFVAYSSKGLLVPDDVTVRLWKAALDSRVDSHVYKPDIDFLVLDGIPRNVEQARLLEAHVEVHHVFHLSCPNRAELAARLRKRALKDNRLDDASDEVIARRIRTYEEESKPILEYYKPQMICEIDATQPPVLVLQAIINRITSLPSWRAANGL